MINSKPLTVKILRAIAFFLIMLIFVTFRYPAFKALWIGSLLLLAGFILLIIAGLKDEELRKIPIVSLKSLDLIIYMLFYVMFSIVQDHFGIKINTATIRSLAQNNVFFVTYLLLAVFGLVRIFLQPIKSSQ